MKLRLSLALEHLLILVICGFTLAFVFSGVGTSGLLGVLRLLVGLVFTLLLPGYYISLIVFPDNKHLDFVERFAFSFVLSISVIPITALILDAIHVPLNLPVVFSIEFSFIIIGLIIAWIRRRVLAPEDRFVIIIDLPNRADIAAQVRQNRRLFSILVIALVAALCAGLLIISQPGQAEQFTEFYILGPNKVAENFPTDLQLGQSATVTVGVLNNEGHTINYYIEITNGNEKTDSERLIHRTESFSLQDSTRFEEAISFTPNLEGSNIIVRFKLYREGDTKPYRILLLGMKIQPPSNS